MTAAIPKGHEGLIPHLVCDGCRDAIEFYKKAFGAVEVCAVLAPGGPKIMHAEMQIDGRPLFVVDDFPEFCEGKSESPKTLGGTPVTIHRFVADCDAVIDRAVKAGATVKMPAADMFWGDRYGVVTDPFGHNWSIATHKQDLTPEQIAKNMEQAFAQMQ
jgi:uncharacterized glyoxalase superfamily protein PhnB